MAAGTTRKACTQECRQASLLGGVLRRSQLVWLPQDMTHDNTTGQGQCEAGGQGEEGEGGGGRTLSRISSGSRTSQNEDKGDALYYSAARKRRRKKERKKYTHTHTHTHNSGTIDLV